MTSRPVRSVLIAAPAAAAVAAALATCMAAASARAAEPEVHYPAKVTTLKGRIIAFEDLGTELEDGAFVYYDGETEGRVSWRDLDRVTFVGNLGHRPGALGPVVPHSRRATLRHVDGSERTVNLVVGRIHGYDGREQRELHPRELAVIDFDEDRIAPTSYATCPRGHAWEQADYRFCPYDGDRLTNVPLR